MSQQINLCTPILLTQKRYFSANTMATSLLVFLLLGGVLCATWVWKLNQASDAYQLSITSHAHEIEGLQAAFQSSQASSAPLDPALSALMQARHAAIEQREKLKEALKEGIFQPGWGHSDRLTWVAHSIPDPVWITEVRMDARRFEVKGFTLEPAALNEWVDKLAASPLMQGLKLATVKVDNASVAASTASVVGVPAPGTLSASAPELPARAKWSFSLVSIAPSASGVATATSAPGNKP